MQQSIWIHGLANLSAALLLTGILGVLVALSALLWLSGRGLQLARREVATLAPRALAHALRAQQQIELESEARVFRPHIALLSAWRGVKAGVAALVEGPKDAQP